MGVTPARTLVAEGLLLVRAGRRFAAALVQSARFHHLSRSGRFFSTLLVGDAGNRLRERASYENNRSVRPPPPRSGSTFEHAVASPKTLNHRVEAGAPARSTALDLGGGRSGRTEDHQSRPARQPISKGVCREAAPRSRGSYPDKEVLYPVAHFRIGPLHFCNTKKGFEPRPGDQILIFDYTGTIDRDNALLAPRLDQILFQGQDGALFLPAQLRSAPGTDIFRTLDDVVVRRRRKPPSV